MSGRHKWSELRKTFSPEMLRAIEIETEKLRIEWGLPEVPEEYEMTDDDICWPSSGVPDYENADALNGNDSPLPEDEELLTDVYARHG